MLPVSVTESNQCHRGKRRDSRCEGFSANGREELRWKAGK